MVFNSDRTGNMEVYAMRADGTGVRQLTADRSVNSWWARISPDRTRVLFYRTPIGTGPDREHEETSLWVMNADGSGQRMLRPKGADGWEVQGHAEWSPDGRELVMFGGRGISPQVFVTDTEGKILRQLTDRGGQNIDPSWSPDGATVVFVACPLFICFPAQYEIYTVPAHGGDIRRLTHNSVRDHDPYYSPDGKRIAWIAETQPNAYGILGIWNIFVMNADGSDQKNLTNDRQLNSKPHWSPDGSSIFFHRFMPGQSDRWHIFRIGADGTGLTDLSKDAPGNSEYPAI
jgi:Tol biopolymer transport system component